MQLYKAVHCIRKCTLYNANWIRNCALYKAVHWIRQCALHNTRLESAHSKTQIRKCTLYKAVHWIRKCTLYNAHWIRNCALYKAVHWIRQCALHNTRLQSAHSKTQIRKCTLYNPVHCWTHKGVLCSYSIELTFSSLKRPAGEADGLKSFSSPTFTAEVRYRTS